MIEWLKKHIQFHAFVRDGRYFNRLFWFLPAKEITKQEFDTIMSTKRITEMRFKMDPHKIGDFLSGVLHDIKQFNEEDFSPYGERVVLTPIRCKEFLRYDGYELDGVWKCETVSGSYIHDFSIHVAGFSGPAVDRGAKPSEWLPAMIQLQLSGASATEEDHDAFLRAFKAEKIREDSSDELREQQ
ncbi:hypothetical protein GZH47_33330 (plasmid) [Paenibacillus rhizovicinus]|uniref:Uncharacterized protein n=1 Tax=Paenibacillus rhizovicinus TaxID=2704463 RepID=A0A6C0PB84_9BACL|nr:hypothetical protein [Paenibacillus rhizovicinus]QHW35778.1 hypothetical protein GZH47_33330 [Paenibacillus rhizovicinus]